MQHKQRRRKYLMQKKQAGRRGISWEMTYIQWIKIWLESGHWYERGKKRGQYQMARFGDKGPYSPDNVKIITGKENIQEAHLGKKLSNETRSKVSLNHARHWLGKKRSIETKTKMSRSKIGNKNALGYKQTTEHVAKRVAALKGKKYQKQK